MAYDEHLADRVRFELNDQKAQYEKLKMMSGMCFMVDDKMCIGVIEDTLMAWIDVENIDEYVAIEGVGPMQFTGKPIKNFLTAQPEAVNTDNDLAYWVEQRLLFNAEAKLSKR
tara:strand:+ start:63 stop:401 length:339 start_codon:yes stop_codon:yes gene_type:complete